MQAISVQHHIMIQKSKIISEAHTWDQLNSGRHHGGCNIRADLGRVRRTSSGREEGYIHSTSVFPNLNAIDILDE